jgi:hypothetical protein
MAYLTEENIISICYNIVTRRKILGVLKYNIYPRDMSNPSMSTTCPIITAESSTIFKASSSLQVSVKPSLAPSKSAQGYKDMKIPRVRLADYLILARIISRDLIGRLSSI